jgi:hypothetical protein
MRIDRGLFRVAVLASLLAGCGEKEDVTNDPGPLAPPGVQPPAAPDDDDALDELDQDFTRPGAADPGGSDNGPAAVPAPACAPYFGTSGSKSAWVYVDSSGNLAYKRTAKGDQIMDFSTAGYGGGGVKIPDVPTRVTVHPSATGGDDTAAIQAAIDEVATRPLANGTRGAVLLDQGTFHVAGTLHITSSGVVLRGRGPDKTTVSMTGGSHHFLDVHGSGSATLVASPKTAFTDMYVGSGSATIHVVSAAGFAVGDQVMVTRPVTAAWVALLGMDKLTRHNKPQTWIKPGTMQRWERTIVAISGNTITLDIPLSDSFDRAYVNPPGGLLQKYTFSSRITQVGLEHLRAVAPVRSADHEMNLINLDIAQDAWVRDIDALNFRGGVSVGGGARRVTVEDVSLDHQPTTYAPSAAPADFNVNGQQVLVLRSSSTGGNKIWYAVTHNSARGPNVFLDFVATGQHSHFAPHQRWATGLLVDRADVDGGIALANLGNSGSGHGWTMGWGVLWNCIANTNVQGPPGATNWAIGCKGTASTPGGTPGMPGSPPLPQGTYDSQNRPVIPESLYLAQLCQRLGPQAVANIGY